MPQYIGNWIECHNQKCGFPIRVPLHPQFPRESEFLFACPLCLHVNSYRKKDLQTVQFRSADPYKGGKLALYGVHLQCGHARCAEKVLVFTTAATKVSVAALMGVWKGWKLKWRCRGGHNFRLPGLAAWWVEQRKSLAEEKQRERGSVQKVDQSSRKRTGSGALRA